MIKYTIPYINFCFFNFFLLEFFIIIKNIGCIPP